MFSVGKEKERVHRWLRKRVCSIVLERTSVCSLLTKRKSALGVGRGKQRCQLLAEGRRNGISPKGFVVRVPVLIVSPYRGRDAISHGRRPAGRPRAALSTRLFLGVLSRNWRFVREERKSWGLSIGASFGVELAGLKLVLLTVVGGGGSAAPLAAVVVVVTAVGGDVLVGLLLFWLLLLLLLLLQLLVPLLLS